ncbi:hypothetical protein [Serratia odorifera]|uniref:Uncharacterized protein n=2 Tax=Serratia odorifera TaxID=618 RepID=D4E0Z6_SEROD|nr:hypothetical protein [Serratia odorifera]EFE96341.1 hypothetical protein HMPREF0758_1770 [Serratia odorifera DSM 4582]PNK91162.1 hypothetical protein CEQ31_016445 [Serratia odorifera]RII72020.1 hypothetical protein DX901_09940 [Serratia odorifera]VDZ56762.1 Uncharacterised protein [Serratia odorifera]
MKPQDEIGGMRELTTFQMDHSAKGSLIILRSSFVDTLTYLGVENAPRYADQDVMIKLSVAKRLMHELQKRIDYIESGIEESVDHPIIM